MGVVNVTPDSFSDGGDYLDATAAVAHGRRLIDEGADVIDVGGESSRPGADPVDEAEELRRVIPVIEALAGLVRMSVDTVKPAVARAACAAGCDAGQRRLGVARRGGRRVRGRLRRHAPPGHAQDDAARTPLRRRDGRGQGLPGRTGARRHAARHRRGVDRSGHRVRQDLVSQPEPAAPSRRDRRPGLAGAGRAPAARGSWGPCSGRSDGSGEPAAADDRLEASVATATWAMALGARMVRVHDVLPTVHAAKVVAA